MNVVSPGRARRREAGPRSRPYARRWTLTASLPRGRRSHPDRRTASCESLLGGGSGACAAPRRDAFVRAEPKVVSLEAEQTEEDAVVIGHGQAAPTRTTQH